MGILNTPIFPYYSWNGGTHLPSGSITVTMTIFDLDTLLVYDDIVATSTSLDFDSVIESINFLLNGQLTVGAQFDYGTDEVTYPLRHKINAFKYYPPGTSTVPADRLKVLYKVKYNDEPYGPVSEFEVPGGLSTIDGGNHLLENWYREDVWQPYQLSYGRVDEHRVKAPQAISLGAPALSRTTYGDGYVAQLFSYPAVQATQVFGYRRGDPNFDCDAIGSSYGRVNLLEELVLAVRSGARLYFHESPTSVHAVELLDQAMVENLAQAVTERVNGRFYEVEIAHMLKGITETGTRFQYE
jgi:hypothetical protein